MNWDMLSAFSEVAGVLAVVVSLLYLSRQVRTSNQLARAEASLSPTSDPNMLNASFGVNPSFQSVLRATEKYA